MARETILFDLPAIYPEIPAYRAAVQARNWPAARAIYDGAPSWELRQMLVDDASQLPGVEMFLRDVLTYDPHDPVAATLLGARLVTLGWEARTARRAKYVSERRFAIFHDHLRQAEAVLAPLCERDPVNPPAWRERIKIARGLQLGIDEAHRRYEELSKHVPHYLPAQRSMMQNIHPKWGGSFSLLHSFAATCTEAAPPGANSGLLVVEAHLETYLKLPIREMSAYLESDATKRSMYAAAERSVFHTSFGRTIGWISALSWFALGFTLIKDWPKAKRCFMLLGNYGDDEAWLHGSLGFNARKNFLRARETAMRKG